MLLPLDEARHNAVACLFAVSQQRRRLRLGPRVAYFAALFNFAFFLSAVLRTLLFSSRFRSLTAVGVTSISSPSLTYPIASSRVILRGGDRRICGA